MRIKTLNVTSIPENGIPGIEVFGDPNVWKLLCKASCIEEGWMKSTKAMEIPGLGCLVQVTTHQIERDGTHAVAEALAFVPGVGIYEEARVEDGEVAYRRLVGEVAYRRLVSAGEAKTPTDEVVDMNTEDQPSLGEGISHVVRLTRKGLINAKKTFGPVKFGKPDAPIDMNTESQPDLPGPKVVKKPTAKKAAPKKTSKAKTKAAKK